MHKGLCIVRINKDVLNISGTVITDRNASSDYVRFASAPEGLRIIDKELVFARYWNHADPIEKDCHTSIKCAEVLVPDKVPIDFLLGAYVSCEESCRILYDIIENSKPDFKIVVNSDLFFM